MRHLAKSRFAFEAAFGVAKAPGGVIAKQSPESDPQWARNSHNPPLNLKPERATDPTGAAMKPER
ncbi:hypothetical protein [Salipiger aestuarii]|uniref:hypothetical protein n=1 Tax=Salipiger aestuarii TaxID=568098 RepID=UPI001238CE39|nr:hypothetical protein [Salipiger aestuarii]